MHVFDAVHLVRTNLATTTGPGDQVASNGLDRNRHVRQQLLHGVANSRICELPQKPPLTYQRFGFAHRDGNCTEQVSQPVTKVKKKLKEYPRARRAAIVQFEISYLKFEI